MTDLAEFVAAQMKEREMSARQYRSPYLRCQARYYKPPACDQVNAVPVEECRLYVERLLRETVQRGALPTPDSAPSNHEAHLASITAEHDKAEAELTALIELQGRAVAAAAPHYQARIDLLAEQIAALDQRRRVLIGTQQAQADSRKRQATAIAEIAADLPFLWTLPEPEINQRLYRLLGDWRISVVRGRIKGLVSLV